MPTAQPRALDAPDRIPALLADAFSAYQDRPGPRAREQLSLELRSEIRRLPPKVQAQMDSITPRTRDLHARDTAIDAARDELSRGLSPIICFIRQPEGAPRCTLPAGHYDEHRHVYSGEFRNGVRVGTSWPRRSPRETQAD
ncbi:hypothetical protein [Streptomyces sp. NPDC048527]|uniref:hypothetical protein n=1 Tax=Streptomyces sp. NPDC048527 TaxID=3365568 RepID=UPI00371258B4